MVKKIALGGLFVAVLAGLTLTASGQGPVRRVLQKTFGPPAVPLAVCDPATGQCAPVTAAVIVPPQPMASSTKVGAVKASGPLGGTLVHEFVRLRVAAELRKKGQSWSDAHAAAASLSNQMIEAAAGLPDVGAPSGFFQQLLADLMAFLQSPQGQQIMAALIKALLALLGVP